MLNRVGARSVVAPVDGVPAGGGARAEADRTHNARHALDAAGLPWAAGAMLRVGFWGIVASPEPPPRAMCRSADGGPPLAPLPAALGAHTAEEMRDQFGVRYTLRRDQFSGRLVRLLFFLGVDLAVNCLADGAHCRRSNLCGCGGGPRLLTPLLLPREQARTTAASGRPGRSRRATTTRP